MARIDWPTGIALANVRWSQTQVEQVNRSPWSGRTRIAQFGPAARWSAEGELPPMKDATALLWRAFVMSLKGRQNTFRLEAVEADQHSGTPTVQANGAASAGATSISLKGLPNSTTLLAAGRFITVTLASGDEQLLGLTAALTSNGSGIATATLSGPLRENVANNAAVQTKRPWGLMRAVDPLAWTVEPGAIYGHSLTAEEAF